MTSDPCSQRIIILDGGLGTTLENILGTSVAHSPLWSTQAVIDNPSAVVKAHLEFLKAGARIIETSTYQSTLPNLVKEARLPEDEAREVMLQAVRLAQEAKHVFIKEQHSSVPISGEEISIALSLGPLGGTLRPTQEFLGYYPPPFGPKAFDQHGTNIKDFDNPAEELNTIDALSQFHLDRLLLFSNDPDVWDSIHYLAFETVLLPREVVAIRKAVKLLESHLISTGREFSKSWWISFVFPDSPTESIIQVEPLVNAALSGGAGDLPRPSGIGINCTPLDHLVPLVPYMIEKIEAFPTASKLFLVLYPNAGIYDSTNHGWNAEYPGAEKGWALKFRDILTEVISSNKKPADGRWGAIIAGGCCRARPPYIHSLSDEIQEMRS